MQKPFNILIGVSANSDNNDGNYDTSEPSNLSEEQETQEKTEKFGNEIFDAHDDVIALQLDRGDNKDCPPGSSPARIQEDIPENSDFKRKIEDLPREKTATESTMVPKLDEYAEIEQIRLETPEKLHLDELPDLEDIERNDLPAEEDIFVQKQENHPKIEIISEMTNDGDSELEENNKFTFEHSVGEVPTSIFSNGSKIRKEQEKECLRPLVEGFFTEPSHSEKYLETKDEQTNPCKVLIREIITKPADSTLLSSVCNQPGDPSPWEGDSKITVACPGESSDGAVQSLAEGEGCPYEAQDGKDSERGLDKNFEQTKSGAPCLADCIQLFSRCKVQQLDC